MLTCLSTLSDNQPSFRKPLVLAIIAALMPLSSRAAEPGRLETVIVRGQRIDQKLQAEQAMNPGATTIINGDEQFSRGVANLADTLRYTPSIWAQSASGGDAIFFSSRGSNLDATDYDENGIKLLQDGLPVTTADGNNHNRFVDPLSARYIVVAPGANALIYGASTLGGAINFISPTARDSAPLELFVSGGSDGLLTARATASTVSGQFDGIVALESKQWDGYRDHSETERQGIYANAGWQFSDAVENRVFFSYVDNDQQLPSALTETEMKDDPEQAGAAALAANRGKDLNSWRIADKTTWRIDERSTLEFGVSHEEQNLYHPIVQPILVDFDGPGPGVPQEVFSLVIDTDHRDTGVTLRYNVQLDNHDVLVGVDYGIGDVKGGNYRNRDGERNGLTEKVDNDADTVQAYAMDRWTVERWTLVYGAQIVSANREVKTTTVSDGSVRNPEDDYSSVNPRAGVIFALSDNNQLFANVSRLFEPPTTFELEDDVSASDETLEAMQGTVVEFGTRGQAAIGQASNWHWDATLYYAQIRDEILSMDDPNSPGDSLTTNIDKTTHAGIEMLAGASFAIGIGTHRIEPLISITYNDFQFDGDDVYGDNDLPAAPGYAVRGEILLRHLSGYYFGPTFDIVDERYVDFSNSYQVDGYELIGLRGGYETKDWKAFVDLKNLTDEEYVSTVSVRDVAAANADVLYPGAPRSVQVGFRVQF